MAFPEIYCRDAHKNNLTRQAELIAHTLLDLYIQKNRTTFKRKLALDWIAEHLYPDTLFDDSGTLINKVSGIINRVASFEIDADKARLLPSPD